MKRVAAILGVLLVFAFVSISQETEKKETPAAKANSQIPEEEAKRANPVKPSEESIATGKKLFVTQCAMCHGTEGDGKGDLADELKLNTHDWRDPASLKDKTDGTLFYILTRGHGKMPAQEDRMKADQKWHLINFIRSLAKKDEKSKETKPTP